MERPVAHEERLYLRPFIDAVLESLAKNVAFPRSKVARRAWRSHWGKRAYGDRVSADDLGRRTQARKQYLRCVFGHVRQAVREIVEREPDKMRWLQERLSTRRTRMRSEMAAIAAAIEAALDLLWLQEHTRQSNRTLRLALCYSAFKSAFGDIPAVAGTYARELQDLFGNVGIELHVCAVADMGESANVPAEIDSVSIHFRNVSLSELAAFPGMKAPGLMAACADAIDQGVDVVVTIDGDGRLPLFEVVPAIAALLRSEVTDVALGSRRIPGALVSKPGFRHFTSVANACYVHVLMGPVLGRVHDPQAIFKVFRRDRLTRALKRLGYDENKGWAVNDMQDGSLACELLLLAHLTDDGCPPRLVEVPAIETMAYPANPRRMPILAGGQVSGMIAAVIRTRLVTREHPLLGEGTESIVLHQPHGEVVKVPRCPERPAVRGLLPISKVADNRLLGFAFSFGGPVRTLVCSVASRSHPDRGFGLTAATVDLISDGRQAVRACLPASTHWEYLDHAMRLPLPTAVIVKACLQIDRWLWASGRMLEWVGMLPLPLVRIIGAGVRTACRITRLLRATARPIKKIILRGASWFLRAWDRVAPLARRCALRTMTFLEVVGALRIFAAVDHLDQRSRFVHSFLRGVVRILVEFHWLLEGFNISIHFGRPVLSLVQEQPVRPLWSVLSALPVSMTVEVQRLLDEALALYSDLGKAGYYDGELSLDNLGVVIDGCEVSVVLIDYGSVVNAGHCSPALLGQWLGNIRNDYEKSYQVYKLRRYAHGHYDTERIVDTYINQSLELLGTWIQRTTMPG